jgi:hypothetical protein
MSQFELSVHAIEQVEPFAQSSLQSLSFEHESVQVFPALHVKRQFCLSLQTHACPHSPDVGVGIPAASEPLPPSGDVDASDVGDGVPLDDDAPEDPTTLPLPISQS